MPQLADIAGPMVFAELPEHIGVGLPDVACVLGSVLLGEVIDKLRDVLGPFAEGRRVQFDHVEPVIEVLSKTSFADLRFKIPVRRDARAFVEAVRKAEKT